MCKQVLWWHSPKVMPTLKNVSAPRSSRSNSFCLDWGTPDFQIPESKCATPEPPGAGPGCAQPWQPWQEMEELQHPAGSAPADTQEPELLTHSTSPGLLKPPSSLAHFLPLTAAPSIPPQLWQLEAQSHLTPSFFQPSFYLSVFNTQFLSKHWRRNLVNPVIPQFLCPCKDTTFLWLLWNWAKALPWALCVSEGRTDSRGTAVLTLRVCTFDFMNYIPPLYEQSVEFQCNFNLLLQQVFTIKGLYKIWYLVSKGC